MATPRVFVSHSHQDDAFTRRLVDDLIAAGADVWVDVAGVGADDFQERINQALMTCAWFVLVLTPSAIRSPWVKMEVHAAIRLKVQGRMRAVIQVLAEPIAQADIPPTWGNFSHFVATEDYPTARNQVLDVLGLPPLREPPKPPHPPQQSKGASSIPVMPLAHPILDKVPSRLVSLGFEGRPPGSTKVILPPLCKAQEGSFRMGTHKRWNIRVSNFLPPDDELPQHRVYLPTFLIGRYPVTVAEYACAVRAQAVREPPDYHGTDWQTQLQNLDHPVVCVSWQDAQAYVGWLAKATGQSWHLPTEAEWEKAARGSDGRRYPWGDEENWDRANVLENLMESRNIRRIDSVMTTPVGAYADWGDASPYDVHDLVGNVWEWTSSLLLPYPYDPNDGRENLDSTLLAPYQFNLYDGMKHFDYTRNRVMRGSSFGHGGGMAYTAMRSGRNPDVLSNDCGFRLAIAPSGS